MRSGNLEGAPLRSSPADPRARSARLLLGGLAALALVWAFEPLAAGGQAPARARQVEAADLFSLAVAELGPDMGPRAQPAGTLEMTVSIEPGTDVAAMLARAGADPVEAGQAAAAIAADEIGPGSELAILLGERGPEGRSLERVELRSPGGKSFALSKRGDGAFAAAAAPLPSATMLRRIRGEARGGLYWSMRAAGVPAPAAEDYMEAVILHAPGERIGESDRFDVVLSGDRLLYAALDRNRGPSVELARWPGSTGMQWLRPDARPASPAALMRPVSGRVTSPYGYRMHPILRFGRLHRGVDFQASWGTPVRAAADGLVSAAGWSGGYGSQVRIAHAGGLQTSYSHLSSMVAEAGSRVRRGQVIGYAGSSGLSTGPHLHYEVTAGGEPIDPLSAPHVSTGTSEADMVRVRQWFERLRAVQPRPAA